MVKYLMVGAMLFGASVVVPLSASAQTAAKESTQEASTEDPNDKAQVDRSFEETRKHMQHHSEWSKKSGKMNDN